MSSRRRYESSPTRAQEMKQPFPVKLFELQTQSEMYTNYPEYQRDEVWPQKYMWSLIERILSGRAIVPLVAYKDTDVLGNVRFYILDGRQRLTTIIRYLRDEFKTWTPAQKSKAEPGSSPSVCPGCRFSELPAEARNNFLNYVLYMVVEEHLDDAEGREHFRASQNHMALSPAEIVSTYDSRAKAIAEKVQTHPFWYEFWSGKPSKRNETFRNSLQLLGTELVGGRPSDLGSSSFFHSLASGKRDQTISEESAQKIIERLDLVSVLFSGAHYTIRSSCIGMYQAVLLLHSSGIEIDIQRDRGKLTPWFFAVSDAVEEGYKVSSYLHGFRYLEQKRVQIDFWDKYRKEVLCVFGLKEAIVPATVY